MLIERAHFENRSYLQIALIKIRLGQKRQREKQKPKTLTRTKGEKRNQQMKRTLIIRVTLSVELFHAKLEGRFYCAH